MSNEDSIVVFYDPEGNEVSNDPRWIAKQQRMMFEDTVSEPDAAVTEQGVESKPRTLDNFSAKELKQEAKNRKEAGRNLDTKGISTKQELLDLLKADDEAREDEEARDDDEDEESEGEDDGEDGEEEN